MFGLNKKKKKGYVPEFGDGADFKAKYSNTDGISLFRMRNERVSIDLDKLNQKRILVINDNSQSIQNELVNQILLQGESSYIVYDRNGLYYQNLKDQMLGLGYDVQLIDLNHPNNVSRINLFETANILHSTHSIALLLAGTLPSQGEVEVNVAYQLLTALMQYCLFVYNEISIDRLYSIFIKLYNKQPAIWNAVDLHEASHDAIRFVAQSDPAARRAVFENMNQYLFNQINLNKFTNPNIFATTGFNKKTIYFVKQCSPMYLYAMTAFMANISIASSFLGKDKQKVVVITPEDCSWYNDVSVFVSNKTNDHIWNNVYFIDIHAAMDEEDIKKSQFVLYMHSSDDYTKELALKYLSLKHTSTEEERAIISKKYYKKKAIPEEVLDLAPITKADFDTLSDAILFGTGNDFKPTICQGLKNSQRNIV